ETFMSYRRGRRTSAVSPSFHGSTPLDEAQRPAESCGARLALHPHILTAMLSRVTACSLVVLVLLPFTAPFRTCELSAFFAARTQHAPINRPAATTLASDASVASVPAISHISRARLLQAS